VVGQPDSPAAETNVPSPAPGGDEATPITARVCALGGAPRLTCPTGEPITGFRSNAVQLLALLVAHRTGMDLPDIMEAIHHFSGTW
jgi:hypothetical protein